MINEVQAAKLDRRFTLLDLTGDNYVQREDYEELARRLAQGASLPLDHPQRQDIVDSLLGLWEAIAAKVDGDGDGRISRDEWHASVAKSIIERDGFDRIIAPVAEAVLAGYDADSDGELDQDEFESFLTAMGVDAGDASAAFDQIDTDGTGALTLDEITEALRDFYTSPDPDALGNALYGKI
ncbi:Ca2+-binding EF-hand superfamily protein [Allocatelliglobosispora scoriae]|uniref:Ca2+-binding EF-hand superfamily protein n=1 Tax=Allocatelliglobosispora scoriae TaxID=643052 RepID=A0A841C0D2_9ACTN|nr:EF-hand domain-containing protein [Allocatelliglobosispora scoriae]MBB5872809.1 Ca2+-binding EF-hand superfamily protein [Allocatelliglobosispora scoriae]